MLFWGIIEVIFIAIYYFYVRENIVFLPWKLQPIRIFDVFYFQVTSVHFICFKSKINANFVEFYGHSKICLWLSMGNSVG